MDCRKIQQHILDEMDNKVQTDLDTDSEPLPNESGAGLFCRPAPI